jgi:hypothetical protein
MNYCTLTINGTKTGIKFGMASFRYLGDGKLVEGKTHKGDELNEIGIAHILYSGYWNNCIVKDAEPELTFSDFVDYIESNLRNEEAMVEIRNALEIWTKNEFIKQVNEPETKKKTTPSKKLKPTPSVK